MDNFKVQVIKQGEVTEYELPFNPTEYKFTYNECGCKYLSFFRLISDEREKYELQVWKDMTNFKINRFITNPDKPTLLVPDGLVYQGPVPVSQEALKSLIMDKTKLYL